MLWIEFTFNSQNSHWAWWCSEVEAVGGEALTVGPSWWGQCPWQQEAGSSLLWVRRWPSMSQEEGPLQEWSCLHLDLVHPGSGAARKKCLLFKALCVVVCYGNWSWRRHQRGEGGSCRTNGSQIKSLESRSQALYGPCSQRRQINQGETHSSPKC